MVEKSILGERIKMRRLEKRLTQENLGEITDTTSSYIGQIERGERQPSLKKLINISEALGISIDNLTIKEERINTNKKLNKKEELMDEILKLIKRYGY